MKSFDFAEPPQKISGFQGHVDCISGTAGLVTQIRFIVD